MWSPQHSADDLSLSLHDVRNKKQKHATLTSFPRWVKHKSTKYTLTLQLTDDTRLMETDDDNKQFIPGHHPYHVLLFGCFYTIWER